MIASVEVAFRAPPKSYRIGRRERLENRRPKGGILTNRKRRFSISGWTKTKGGPMPEKQSTQVVKHGDVTQRVGVEVIRARGVDVEKLITMLIANAAAEFASTYY